MPKPVLLVVDDNEAARRLLERDLDRAYGERYRVVGAPSGGEALETLRRLKAANESVALLLVDQRMPHLTGVEFLEQAITLVPDTKRVINRVDHTLPKPWHPPEQILYPVLDDLLADWEAGFRPPFQGLRVVGYRFSPRSHQTRTSSCATACPSCGSTSSATRRRAGCWRPRG